MVMRGSIATLSVSCALLGTTLSGCVSMGASMGIRPAEPKVMARAADGKLIDDCTQYQEYAQYAQNLMEAYHTRATHNRGWIYVAGITGLGVTAASGGLAAAAAVSAGTLALLAIGGGFAAGSFAVIDNPDLAKIYTISANRVDLALKVSELQMRQSTAANVPGCGAALTQLREGVWDARTTLESSRTDTAVLALVRAKEQQRILQELIGTQRDTLPTRVTLDGLITEVVPKEVTQGQSKTITLTVSNVQLDIVPVADLKVALGSKILDLAEVPTRSTSVANQYTVKFLAPAQPPDKEQVTEGTAVVTKDVMKYVPFLLVGPSKQRVPTSKPELVIEYKKAPPAG